jgi:hypothetical protein
VNVAGDMKPSELLIRRLIGRGERITRSFEIQEIRQIIRSAARRLAFYGKTDELRFHERFIEIEREKRHGIALVNPCRNPIS